MRVEQNLNYVNAASVHRAKKQADMEQTTFAGRIKEKELPVYFKE